MKSNASFTYLGCLFFIMGWWATAFICFPYYTAPLKHPDIQKEDLLDGSLFASLPPLNRNNIYKALLGDYSAMLSLISDWDVEAELLWNEGVADIKKLPRNMFLRAHVLGKKLPHSQQVKYRFLPQTYVAASFLLSLVQPEQIVALPKGIRRQTQLYPPELTAKIPINVEEYTNEQLYLLKPDLAFAASYSHPSPLKTMKNQGIPVVVLPDIRTIEEISSSLRFFGEQAGMPNEAELLAIFVEAALCAIDNRITLLRNNVGDGSFKNFVYLNSHLQHSLPASRSLIGQALARMKINRSFQKSLQNNRHLWRIPIAQEEILYTNPDCLIISSLHPIKILSSITENPALRNLEAVKHNKVYLLDETTQETPSQFFVLAYFELYEILAGAHR